MSAMSATPACPAARPLLALLSDAVLALLDPPQAPTRPRPAASRAPAGGYAAFEAPTYQRRGIRIAGLDAPAATAPRPAAVPGAVTVRRASSRA